MDDLKKELGIWDAPEARWGKPLSEAKAAAAGRKLEAEASRSVSRSFYCHLLSQVDPSVLGLHDHRDRMGVRWAQCSAS